MNVIPYCLRNADLWAPGWCRSAIEKRSLPPAKTVWVMIGDHYEPYWRGADDATARRRVEEWRKKWPAIAARYRDSAGNVPRYTFFYAEEEYHPALLDVLAGMSRDGCADVEIHLHHDAEPAAAFTSRVERFKETLHGRHGLLREQDGKIIFGFIHGNWALDNSRPDGKWCGLNNEISLLRDLGCYADFTLPSAPNRAQTRLVNTIYMAVDDPERPRSHDTGRPVKQGVWPEGDLLIVPGPLGWNFRGDCRFPRLETGELAAYDLPVEGRANSWFLLAPQIGDQKFVKLFTHGTQESNSTALLGGGLDTCFGDLSSEAARHGVELRFATAWEMRVAIEAACRQTSSDAISSMTPFERSASGQV